MNQMQTSDNVTFQLLLNSRNSHRVPTDHKSGRVGENQGTEVRETSGNFVGGQGKTACIMRLSKCFCNIVSGQKRDELFLIGLFLN